MECRPSMQLLSILLTVFSLAGTNNSKNSQPPEFFATETNVSYYVGDTATIWCGVNNQGSKTVSWQRVQDLSPLTIGAFRFTRDGRISATHNRYKHLWGLHIEDVKMRDMGVYECKISTRHLMTKHFFLNIVERQPREVPKAGVLVTGTDTVEIGQPISLKCNATGKMATPRDVEWFKENGERITTNARLLREITKVASPEQRSLVSYLLINKSGIHDRGTYMCRSTDKFNDRITVLVLNASTYNVKRGTNKNAHSGKDKWTESENGAFVKEQSPNTGRTRNEYYNIPTRMSNKQNDLNIASSHHSTNIYMLLVFYLEVFFWSLN